MESLLKDLFKSSKKDYLVKDYRHLWRKIERDNYQDLELTKEMQQECRRSFWTTYANLNDWFDAWEKFVIEKGFATCNSDGSIEFSEEQRRQIINMDETKFSVDGSDGGVGGHPSLSVTVRGIC